MTNVADTLDRTSGSDVRSRTAPSLYRRLASSTAFWILVLDVLLFVGFGLVSDGVIWSPRAVEAILLGSTQGVLLAIGLAMFMGAGFFDLSLGSNLVLSSVVGALVIRGISSGPADAPVNVVVVALAGGAAALLTGAAFGAINGLLVTYVRINSLIATLATTGIGLGVAFVIAGGADISGMPVELQRGFGQASLFDLVPVSTILALLIAMVLSYVLRRTRSGTATLAIGSSRPAAEGAGIRVRAHIIGLAILAGVLAGLAGFIDISRYGSTALQGHNLDGLAAVTAVVIGGTLLSGGRVSILGAVAGALLAVILRTGLVVIGVASYYQTIAIGVVLIIAVAIDQFYPAVADRSSRKPRKIPIRTPKEMQ